MTNKQAKQKPSTSKEILHPTYFLITSCTTHRALLSELDPQAIGTKKSAIAMDVACKSMATLDSDMADWFAEVAEFGREEKAAVESVEADLKRAGKDVYQHLTLDEILKALGINIYPLIDVYVTHAR